MLSLLSKIRHCLTGKQGKFFSQRACPGDEAPSLGNSSFETQVGAHYSARTPGMGRRSNRDRKSAEPCGDASSFSSTVKMTETSLLEKATLESTIRLMVEELPINIKQSYLTLLDALLTQPESPIQIERIKALHLAVIDASNKQITLPN